MSELVAWFSDTTATRALLPLIAIGIFVTVFLEVHPFQDGNGRLSHFLTTFLLLRAGYHYVPYSSLESVFEQSIEGYYLAPRRTQATIRTDDPDWQQSLRPYKFSSIPPGLLKDALSMVSNRPENSSNDTLDIM